MEPTAFLVTDAELRQWIGELIAGKYTVIAPVRQDRHLLLFGEIRTAEEAVLEPSGKTRWSPKEFLFPKSEALYRYSFVGGQVQVADPSVFDEDQVLIGVRPCDAAGLARLDTIFLTNEVDPMYRQRREHTTVVTVACAGADPECFCTAVGGSPAGGDGSDIQLVPLSVGWLVRILSRRGVELAPSTDGGWWPGTDAEEAEAEEIRRRVEREMDVSPILSEWSEALERGFDDPVWDELAKHCLGCSACAYVCPSCSCFDMNQHGTAWGGEQSRSWDACTFELFTRHSSGHNPRSSTGGRYRQRVLHKFAFRGEGDSEFRCVGCGRCIALCPAGMDISEVVRRAADILQGGCDGSAG